MQVTETDAPEDVFREGDHVLFIGRKGRDPQTEFLVRLVPGNKVKLRGEAFEAEQIIGLPVGASMVTPLNRAYLALRPTLGERIMNMARQAQIIYPKDLAQILFSLNACPGMKVVEVGIGHGAMTMALLQALGPTGFLSSYEIREDHAKRTAKNIRRYLGEVDWWQVTVADAVESGLAERDMDAAMVDMPTAWDMVAPLAPALKPGAPAVFFLPNVNQVMRLCETLRASDQFANIRVSELIQRPWVVDDRSARPAMRISGHTGFLIACRRKLGQVVKLDKGELL